MSKNTKAVVLLSGGLDSTTVLALACQQGYEAYALTLRYGQRHEVEIIAAQKIAKLMQVADHAVLDIDLSVFGGSALTISTPFFARATPHTHHVGKCGTLNPTKGWFLGPVRRFARRLSTVFS